MHYVVDNDYSIGNGKQLQNTLVPWSTSNEIPFEEIGGLQNTIIILLCKPKE